MPEDKTYRNAVVRITELVEVDGLLEGFVFEGCHINGPAIIVPVNTTLVHNHLMGDADALLWEIVPGRAAVSGCIEARGCTFEGCTFANVGFAGPLEVINQFRGGN